ncbi:hypothetical protein [Alteromonas confluentis]|uniref:Carbon starvation protein CstA n=1 Tax=Alteromonas confluentis TaxID=1656094 RepID=A0A1E7ZH28_9ALTE|nr:hypothetical protein [Alteromonas confluentis]OFC72770.1 hypothetical protein BFC18_00135 [Alteromonas confluentis]
MRTLQLLGLVIAIFAGFIGYYFLSDVEPDTSASAAGAAGLFLMFVVAPALLFSAVMVVPSSIALFWPQVREGNYFQGKFWFAIWGCNCLLSSGYLFVAVYIFYLWLKVGNGN